MHPSSTAPIREPLPPETTPERVPAPPWSPTEPSVTCWDCDSPNPPDRIFCTECGTFIAVGSKVFSGGSYPGDPVAMPAVPGGSMSLGSYAVAMRRRSARRRVLLGAVSVVLVAVVGMASLYVATSPGGPDGKPAALAAASTSPAVAQTDEPAEEMGVTAGAIGLSTVELEEELDPVLTEEDPAEPEAQEAEPEAQAAAPEVQEPEPIAEPVAQEPEAPAEPVVEPEPEPVVEPVAEPVIEPTVEEPEPITETVSEPEPEPAAPELQDSAVWRNGWVCDGELRLEDVRLRDWTITRASFLPGIGHERVILHLDRIGAGSGEVASLTAEAFPRLEVEEQVSGVRQPSLGRTAIALQFSDGVKTDFSLRGYRPSGLVAVREFSTYPAGNRGSKVIISTSTDDGCFKVRVPAWTSGANAQKGQIYIDIKS